MKIKNFFGVLLTTSHLATAAYGLNERLLDREADTFTIKISSGVLIKKDEVKKRLGFFTDKDTVDEKYSQSNFYEKVTGQIQDEKFSKFATACKDVYEEGDSTLKIAVNLLLENVAEKYAEFLQNVAKAKQITTELKESTPSLDEDTLLDIFSTADNGTTLLKSK